MQTTSVIDTARAEQQYAPWAAEQIEEDAGKLLYNYVVLTPEKVRGMGIEFE